MHRRIPNFIGGVRVLARFVGGGEMSAVVSRPAIVVCVDGSPFSKAAVWWTARDAESGVAAAPICAWVKARARV
jgi:hypothetical protein